MQAPSLELAARPTSTPRDRVATILEGAQVAKAKFERTKPHVNIGTIGHIDHGKTTLTAAITKVLHDKYPTLNQASAFDQIDKAPEERQDRKSTRLNSSHANISYAVFC